METHLKITLKPNWVFQSHRICFLEEPVSKFLNTNITYHFNNIRLKKAGILAVKYYRKATDFKLISHYIPHIQYMWKFKLFFLELKSYELFSRHRSLNNLIPICFIDTSINILATRAILRRAVSVIWTIVKQGPLVSLHFIL